MDKILKQWIYECLGILIKEPTEENRKIVTKVIVSEIRDMYESKMNKNIKFIPLREGKTTYGKKDINMPKPNIKPHSLKV